MREANNRINSEYTETRCQAVGALVATKEPSGERIINSLERLHRIAFEILEKEKITANAILGTIQEADNKEGTTGIGSGFIARVQNDLDRIESILHRILIEQSRYDAAIAV